MSSSLPEQVQPPAIPPELERLFSEWESHPYTKLIGAMWEKNRTMQSHAMLATAQPSGDLAISLLSEYRGLMINAQVLPQHLIAAGVVTVKAEGE